jgi:pyruvate-ferredoxin/flavodoxin oxidoreductase
MKNGLAQQSLAVKTGYWPLFRFNPLKEKGQRFVLDSKQPSVELSEFLYHENRFDTVKNSLPEKAAEFYQLEVDEIKRRWEKIEALKNL